MGRPPNPLPPALSAAFTVVDARSFGVTAGRLRATDLDRPFHGVRLQSAASRDQLGEVRVLGEDIEVRRAVMRRATAYSLIMPDGAFFAARTAAVILGLPVAHDPTADLCVAVHSPGRGLRAKGVRGVKVSPALASLRVVDGLPVSSPASTWAMLPDELDLRRLIVVGDALVRIPRDAKGRPQPGLRLASIGQLRRAAEVPWRRGRPLLDEALDHIRVGSMSPLETDFRLAAVAAGLPEPDLDVEVRNAGGRLLGISDAVYAEYRTVVEVEGDHHRTTRMQWHRDIEKYAAYNAEGWEVVRLTSEHIRGRDRRAAGIVRAALSRRGWKP